MTDGNVRKHLFSDNFDAETELMYVKRHLSSGRELQHCRLLFDAMFYCFTPKHQMRTYYQEGDFDPCVELGQALRKCFTQSATRNESEPSVSEVDHGGEKLKLPWTFKDSYIERCGAAARRKYDLSSGQAEDTQDSEVQGD